MVIMDLYYTGYKFNRNGDFNYDQKGILESIQSKIQRTYEYHFLEDVHYHSKFKDEPLPTKAEIKEESSWLSKIISIVTNPNTENEELR